MPKEPLGKALDELAKTSPKVAAAKAAYNSTVDRILVDRDHAMPCLNRSCPWHYEQDAEDDDG